MARSDPQVNLRMSAELKDALDKAAEKNGRSLTAEIVDRLKLSLEPAHLPATSADVEEALKQTAALYERRENGLSLMRKIMADHVVQLYNALPKGSELRKHYYVAAQMANALVAEGMPGLETALENYFPNVKPEGAARRLAAVVRESTSAEGSKKS